MSGPPTPTVPLDEAQTPVEGGASGGTLGSGTRIGRYLIVEKIGEGGAGAVYAAFDAKLDRKVALKLLQPGPASPLTTLDPHWPKLVQEARMLAKLSDPEVVTVFDVGEYDGVGYLAMEYVEGGDLSHWIDKHRGVDAEEPRPVADALQLMVQAGEGLACAHRAGLVHGDFKPANVLIDGRGRAKVSDFGIARLRGGAEAASAGLQTLSGDTGATGSGHQTVEGHTGVHWVGTPAFMAPEQFDGVPPSERTDVYAYCTALFQAVYGVLPWRATTMMELATLKSHQPPQRPSGVAVPRWLDRVLDRGLAVDPGVRYASMDAVLVALKRGLRSRRRAAALGVLAVASVVGATSPLWASNGSETSLCETEGFGWQDEARDRVRTAFEAVGHHAPEEAWERVDTRMAALDSAWSDAWQSACTATESPALQRPSLACLQRQRRQAAALVDAWTDGQSLGRELVDRASRAAVALAEPQRCLDADALATADRVPSDPALARAVADARGQIDVAIALSRAGRIQDALPVATEAFAAAEATAFAPVQAEAGVVLGRVHERLGNMEPAEETLRKAYFQAVEADAPAVMAEAATRLMWLLGGRLEKHDEGDLWGDHAMAALEKTGGSPHRVLTHRAALLERRGEFAEAKAALREVLDLLPPAQTYDRGIAYMRFGDLLRREQNGEGAVEAYTTTVELWTEGLGASHPNVAIARAARASGLSRSARNEEAVVEYRAAIAALEKAFGKTHPSLSASLVNLGITLKNLGRFEEAEAVVRRSLALETATFGAEHRKVADRREALGRLLTRRGKGAEALAEHVFAGKVFTEVLEEDHPWLVLNLLNQGDALRQMQALGRAEDAYRGAYERAAAHLDADDSLRSDTAAFYGRALVESGKYARAVATLGPAHADLATREGYEDVLAVAGWALARAQVETGGNVADAVALAKSARAGLAGHPEEVAALDAWVDAHE